MAVRRIDSGGLGKPQKQANGWLRVDGYLTRTGVFAYGMPDGTTRREYRPPEEVFKADTLASFELVPVTDAHPPEFLTAENTTQYQRGAVSAPERQGEKVRGQLLITDAALVAKLEKGDARQVSCGYLCDLEDASGTTSDGQRYDAIQRNIRGNHVAIVPVGRAGPEVRVRMDAGEALDAADASMKCDKCGARADACRTDGKAACCDACTHPQPKQDSLPRRTEKGNTAMAITIRIDGVDFDSSTEAFKQAFEKHQATQAATLAALKKDAEEAAKRADTAQAKADAAAEALAKAQAEAKELPARIRADMQAQADLVAKVKAVLPELKVDGLDSKALRVAALAQLAPELKLDGKSEAYVEARFDAALELAGREDSPWGKDASKLDADPEKHTDSGERLDSDKAKAAFLKASQGAWKTALSSAKSVGA